MRLKLMRLKLMRLRILGGKSLEAGNMGLARGPSTRLLPFGRVLVNLAVNVKTLVFCP
jgi:hypothetical protein